MSFNAKWYILSIIRIDSTGAIELAKNLGKSVLESLNLGYNKIDSVGVQSILEELQANGHIQVTLYAQYFLRKKIVKF